MAIRTLIAEAVAAGAVMVAGCTSSPSPIPGAAAPGWATVRVADVAGQPIFAGDVTAQMRRMRVDPRSALDQLVTFELLARAATDAGVTVPDADDLERVRSVEVERLVEREIEPRISKTSISDADVRTLYERGKARFVHGRLIQVAVLCVFTGARMKPEPRARAEVNARALKTFVDGQTERTPAAFEAISTMPSWVERGVSFTTVWQGEDEPFPRLLGRAVAALSKPGDTTDLVGDETGYYIARYLAEQPPQDVSFTAAAPALRDEMFEPWRRQRFLQLAMEMSNGHDIEVFPEGVKLLASD